MLYLFPAIAFVATVHAFTFAVTNCDNNMEEDKSDSASVNGSEAVADGENNVSEDQPSPPNDVILEASATSASTEATAASTDDPAAPTDATKNRKYYPNMDKFIKSTDATMKYSVSIC